MTAQTDDELWSAIADPSRRQVLDLIVRHRDVSASWLAGRVPFSRHAVSKHLLVLERAELISRRKQGHEVLYQVEADRRLGMIKTACRNRARRTQEEEP